MSGRSLEQINAEIGAARQRLAELYAERKPALEAEKKRRPKRVTVAEREKDVFERAMAGQRLEEIAATLGLTLKTVKMYLLWAIKSDYPRNGRKGDWHSAHRETVKKNMALPEGSRLSLRYIWPWVGVEDNGIRYDDPYWLSE